jgi:hypothetical protein
VARISTYVRRLSFTFAATLLSLPLVCLAQSTPPNADAWGLALELVRSTFPQLKTVERASLDAIVAATYEPIRIRAISFFVEPSETMAKARAARTVTDLHQVLLHATIRFDAASEFDSASFSGRTVSGMENDRFAKDVAAHANWDQAATLDQLRARGAICATKEAVAAKLPLVQWRPMLGALTVEDLTFDNPAARSTPGGIPRSDPYAWEAVLVSEGGQGRRYYAAVEPFGCAVTRLNKRSIPRPSSGPGI